jgi:hypothetical protein
MVGGAAARPMWHVHDLQWTNYMLMTPGIGDATNTRNCQAASLEPFPVKYESIEFLGC